MNKFNNQWKTNKLIRKDTNESINQPDCCMILIIEQAVSWKDGFWITSVSPLKKTYLLSYFWCLLIIDRGSSKFKWSLSLHWHVWFTTVPLTAVYDHKLTRYPWFKNWLCSIVVKTYGFMLQRQWKKLKWRHLPYHWWYGGKGTVLNQACHFFSKCNFK